MVASYPLLKKHYDLVNFSFEGVSGQVPPEGVGFGQPEYDNDDPYKSGDDPTESPDQGGADPTVDADATTTREEPTFLLTHGRICQRRTRWGYRGSPNERVMHQQHLPPACSLSEMVICWTARSSLSNGSKSLNRLVVSGWGWSHEAPT